MTLTQAIDSYVSRKRALGAVFSADTRILRSFARALGDIPVDTSNAAAIHAFCRGTGPPTRWWERKHQARHGFFADLVTRGHLSASPLAEPAPRIARSFPPYIYSRNELQRLLEATTILDDNRGPLQQATFRTLLLTRYGAGLRPSEGLHLRCCDVDLEDHLLTIWDTQFFKSRLVPIGPALCTALCMFHQARRDRPIPSAVHSACFALPNGGAITLNKLEKVLVRLREHAQIHAPPGARRQPRLHDRRHAFVVHRLITWYREGADVQTRLPWLSTYLGHVNLSGTQAYLTMTPARLTEASKRFERYAAIGSDEDHHDDP